MVSSNNDSREETPSDKEKKSQNEEPLKIPKGFENFFNKNVERLKQIAKEQVPKDNNTPNNNSRPQDEQQKSPPKQHQPPIKEFNLHLNVNTILPLLFSAYILYKIVGGSDNSREITWQEFRTAFFDKGLVDKLVVVNRKKVRVYLHSNATGQMYPNAPTLPGSNYYFSIGSVEAFERKIEDAQNELGIPSNERIPVA
ncbi:3757_t:CDS:1, partial [Dentiscutata heterogama]